MPGRRMDYEDTCTAMTITDMAGPEHTHADLRAWIQRELWADRAFARAFVHDGMDCMTVLVDVLAVCKHPRERY